MLAPSWTGHIAIGPWLRGEKYKRFYGAQFTNEGYVNGIQRFFALCNKRDVRVFDSMKGFFEPFLDSQEDVQKELSRIVNPRIKQAVDSIANEGSFVAVHIRRGDFSTLGCAVDDDWYRNALRMAVESSCAQSRTCIRVFTDGYPDQVSFLQHEFPQEKVLIMPKAPAIQDILCMSRSEILVGTPGSTFSMWAAFLGQMPSIWSRRDMPTRLYPSDNRQKTIFVD